jgi:two-component system sensor histidine kinase VanS
VTRARRPGLSVRLKLTLSYVGFLMLAWAGFMLVLAFVLRYLPDANLVDARGGVPAPNRSDLAEAAVRPVVAGTLALAVVGLAGGWLLAGRVLRPLHAISAAAATAAAGSLTHRIDLPGPDDELRRLADGFDTMLDRLETAFEEQRRFTANASHELRTPNAVVKAMLDVAKADPEGRDVDRLIDRTLEMNARSTAVVDALLRLARTEQGGPLATEPCDLADVVRAALANVEGLPEDVRLDLDLAPAPVVADRELLGRMVANLLSNAVRHNVASDGFVAVTTDVKADGSARLVVENPGDELDPAVVPTLVEPFVRGRGRVRSGATDGSGLGLAIVASIARRHGAALELQARPGGGLQVTVRFPAPA